MGGWVPRSLRLVRMVRRPAAGRRNRRGRRAGRRVPLILGLVGGGLAIPFAVLAIIGAVILGLLAPLSGQQNQARAAACTDALTSAAVDAASTGGLDRDQRQNAAAVIGTGQKLKIPTYGWVVSLATALQESRLRNLDYGDRDSLGLFQQRANWGSVAERTDPKTATTMFFTGGRNGYHEAGLLDIRGWQQMSVAEAAQAVQRSAFPDAYADDEPLARALVGELGAGQLPDGCGPVPAQMCPKTPWPGVEHGLKPDALIVLRCLHHRFPKFRTFYGVGDRPAGGDGDHAAGRAVDAMLPFDDYKSPQAKKYGWKVANWLRGHHTDFGIKYIIFDAKIWSVAHDDEGWRPYSHYAGCTSDTCLHYNHIHTSVYGNAARSPSSGDWALPIAPGKYTLTAGFGECGSKWSNCHTGQDFAAPIGTPIHAAAAGTVKFADWGGAYGNLIKIDHGNGVETYYAHQSRFSPGVLGKQVKAGQVIGYVGATGNVTGPHVHFEVRVDGVPRDPMPWLRDHGLNP